VNKRLAGMEGSRREGRQPGKEEGRREGGTEGGGEGGREGGREGDREGGTARDLHPAGGSSPGRHWRGGWEQ
jgi:hypothetical protein